MATVRAFIAVELPDEARRKLDEIEKHLQRLVGDSARRAVRWVPAANIHLTLKFLGEIPKANIPSLVDMLEVETARSAAFNFIIEGTGAFPNTRRPRVIWAGASAPSELLSLQHGIESAARRLGYPAEDRPFSPHLTLGRMAQRAQPEEIEQVTHALETARIGQIAAVRINQVHLFSSHLRPSGPIYTSLHSFPLPDKPQEAAQG